MAIGMIFPSYKPHSVVWCIVPIFICIARRKVHPTQSGYFCYNRWCSSLNHHNRTWGDMEMDSLKQAWYHHIGIDDIMVCVDLCPGRKWTFRRRVMSCIDVWFINVTWGYTAVLKFRVISSHLFKFCDGRCKSWTWISWDILRRVLAVMYVGLGLGVLRMLKHHQVYYPNGVSLTFMYEYTVHYPCGAQL